MTFTGKRQLNWPIRLTKYVQQTMGLPCVVGQNDCVVWALGAVDAMCESDAAEGVRGQFNGPESIQAYLDAHGWATLHDACRDYFGDPLAHGATAQQGDIVVIPSGSKYPIGAMTVLIGQQILSPGPTGLIRLPFTAALMMGAEVFKTGR